MAVKPVIKYQAGADNPFVQSVSIVQKKTLSGTFENWLNKTELTDYVDQLYVPPTSDTYLLVICSCGREYEYATKTNVPAINTDCVCGRKVIKYGI